MKSILAAVVLALTLTLSGRAADASVKLTDVHLCCESCVKGVQKAVGKVSGVTATSDMDDKTISLTGPDAATVQKAVDSLTVAGYYGKSSDAAYTVSAATGAKDQKVKSMEVKDVHLCCGSCVKAVNKALGTVSGVTGNTATKGAKSFTVTGDFNDKEVMDALQKVGLTGQVAKE
jgi:copper chaperone CopZ